MILNGNGKLTKREVTALEDSYLSFEGGLKGYLLHNADEILETRGGEQGLKLYSKLYHDPHVQAVLNKLASAVTSKDWIVAPGGEKRIDQKAADLVRSQLANLNVFDLSLKEENHSSINGFDQLTRAMIVSGRLNGYVCAEVMWANRDDSTVASEIRVRDPRQFGFMRGEQGYVLRHLTREKSWTGETPPLKKILGWSYGALDGSPYGDALGRTIFWPVFFKKSITRFDLKFLERFASPKPTGKYPRGATPQQITELRAALSAIANETEIAIPDGMLIEYLEAASSGTMDAYERSLRYWDEQISEAVLGETGSTNQSGSGGSRARDQVGNEVRIEISKAIADSLSSTFNRLARWITDFNLPGAMPPTVYRDFEQGEEITSRSGVDKVLFDLGYRLTPERVADVYGSGYEQAGGDDKEPALISSLGVGGVQALTGLLTQAATGQLPKENAIAVLVSVFGIAQEAAAKMVPDAPKQEPDDGGLARLFGGQDDAALPEEEQPEFAESEKDAAELIAEKARPLIQDAIAPWLDQVRDFVEQAASLEDIRDGLVDLFPELDDAAFAEAMGQAMLLSDLAGRVEVAQDDADVAFAEAIEAALNGTLDFAAKPKAGAAGGKKPNCNPAKSHFCQTPNGKGACVSLNKVCKYPPTGLEKKTADWKAEKPTTKTETKAKVKAKSAKATATKSTDAEFPSDVSSLKTIKSLGGSTKAVLVEDPATGKRYVKKTGSSPLHIREEFAADKAYEVLGINVPKAQLYETPDGPVKLAGYVEGTPLGNLKGKAKDAAIAELQKGFAADALLGNWDVIGLGNDNIIVSKDGTAYRVDNGGSLRYRAQGSPKKTPLSDEEIKKLPAYETMRLSLGEAAAIQSLKDFTNKDLTEWNAYPTEVWSLRDPKNNPNSAAVFGKLTHSEILGQIEGLSKKKKALLDTLPSELKDTVNARFSELERTAKIGRTFLADNFVEEYTSEFSRHSMQVRQADVLGPMAPKIKGEKPVLTDEDGKEFDNLRGPGGIGDRIQLYVNQNGGDYAHVTRWKNHQSGSTFASVPTTYRYFMAQNRQDVDNVFWGKDEKQETAKNIARELFEKHGTATYKNTMIANHAAEYEMLDALDFPNKNKRDNTVKLKRTIGFDVVHKNGLKAQIGQMAEIQQTAFDSNSLVTWVKVKGLYKTEAQVPLHRILGTYLIPREKGDDSAGFANNKENEFAAMLQGIKFKMLGTD